MADDTPAMFRPVPVDVFLEAHRIVLETYEREGGERSMERTCLILVKNLKRKDAIVQRIMTRMHAFRNVYKDPRIRRWKIEGAPGAGDLIDGAIMRAIAQTPFVRIDDDWTFDPDTFFERVLREAEHDGQG